MIVMAFSRERYARKVEVMAIVWGKEISPTVSRDVRVKLPGSETTEQATIPYCPIYPHIFFLRRALRSFCAVCAWEMVLWPASIIGRRVPVLGAGCGRQKRVPRLFLICQAAAGIPLGPEKEGISMDFRHGL